MDEHLAIWKIMKPCMQEILPRIPVIFAIGKTLHTDIT